MIEDNVKIESVMTYDRGEYRYALDVARYTVCVDRNGLLRIELERCNERRCWNVESRSVNERNVPLMHLHANDGTFFSRRLLQEMTIFFQNYIRGIIIKRRKNA